VTTGGGAAPKRPPRRRTRSVRAAWSAPGIRSVDPRHELDLHVASHIVSDERPGEPETSFAATAP
jgi:hypothetical protein